MCVLFLVKTTTTSALKKSRRGWDLNPSTSFEETGLEPVAYGLRGDLLPLD
jgi:hypothetical protein